MVTSGAVTLIALVELTLAGPVLLTVEVALVWVSGPVLTMLTDGAAMVMPAGVSTTSVGPHISVMVSFDALVTPGGKPLAASVISGVVMVTAGGGPPGPPRVGRGGRGAGAPA